MDSEPTNFALPVSNDADENLRLASQLASINLLFAQQELGRRIISPTITTKNLLDIAEHAYKVSGAAKKVEADTGPGFSIVINLPNGTTATLGTPESAPQKTSVESLVLDARPLIDWDTVPEFSSVEYANE